MLCFTSELLLKAAMVDFVNDNSSDMHGYVELLDNSSLCIYVYVYG